MKMAEWLSAGWMDFYTVVLCLLTSFAVFLFFWSRDDEKWRHLPPGERGWPFFGALSIINGKKTLLQHFLSLHEEYGTSVTSIKLAGKYIVCLNDHDVIKEALQMKELSLRANLTLMTVDTDYRGVIHASGPLWKEHRRFCLRNLRDFGMGRADGEIIIQDELNHLLSHLTHNLNRPVDFSSLISPAINNTMCLFLFATRYDYTDFQNFDRLRELDRLLLTIVPMWKPFVYSPKLMYLPGDIFGYKESRSRLLKFYRFIEEQIEEKRDEEGCFINTFMKERDRQLDSDGETTFTENQLKYTIMDLFMAGTDTTTTFLCWSILLLSVHPKLQTQLQREIYKNLGTRQVSMKDKSKLNLIQAFILEVHRFSSISPINLPHTCEEDVLLRGFFIPKGSSVFANIYGVHRDVNHWKYANEFNLENFLDENGCVVHDPWLIPFATGKRSCVGEALANMEIFLILTTLIQRFRFKLAEKLVSLEGSMEGMNYPPAHRIIITERTLLNGPQTPDTAGIGAKPIFPNIDGNQSNKASEKTPEKPSETETTSKAEESKSSGTNADEANSVQSKPEIFLNDERIEMIKETLRGRRPSLDICDLALQDFLQSGSISKRKSCPDINAARINKLELRTSIDEKTLLDF